MQLTMAQKIKLLREQHKMTLEEVGNIVGVGKSTVRKWETGMIKDMKRDKIGLLAKALKTTPGYLMGWDEPGAAGAASGEIPAGFIPLPPGESLPVVGRIACGSPITAEQNIEGYIPGAGCCRADFALVCQGDSMEPVIRSGDYVCIRRQPEVENGQIAAVRIGEEATLKRVKLTAAEQLQLWPVNPVYDVIIPEPGQDIQIEGLVVYLIRPMNN